MSACRHDCQHKLTHTYSHSTQARTGTHDCGLHTRQSGATQPGMIPVGPGARRPQDQTGRYLVRSFRGTDVGRAKSREASSCCGRGVETSGPRPVLVHLHACVCASVCPHIVQIQDKAYPAQTHLNPAPGSDPQILLLGPRDCSWESLGFWSHVECGTDSGKLSCARRANQHVRECWLVKAIASARR